jgi:mitochondrial fission protein ELM1
MSLGEERLASILFGGQSKHYYYTMRDMEVLADRLIELTRRLPWIKWTFYDSRRSPEAEVDHLVALVKAAGAPVEFVRFAEKGLLSNNPAFRSDLVLVTADSMSMLAESIASRRPTGILFADAYRAPKRDRIEHTAMIADRRAFRVRMSALTAEAVQSGSEKVAALQTSQLETLYEILTQHGI